MYRKFLAALLLASVLASAPAAEVVLNPDHPDTYTVVRGDTLWDIAGRFLRYPWQWPEIWEVNQQIANPHLIYPGDTIALTYRDGRPILGLTRGRNVKLSPSLRETRHETAIPPIPLDAIYQFLTRPRVVTEEQLKQAAYVVGSQDEHLASGVGGRLYVRGLHDAVTNRYSIFRPGGEYVDPETGRVLGYEALHIGDLMIREFGDPASADVLWSNREILKGDRLLPQEEDQYPEFVPRAPAAPVDGSIISVIDGVSQIGQHHVVVVNKGAVDGIEPGHVLAIYQAGEVIEDRIATEIAARERLAALRQAEAENPSAVGRFFDNLANDFREGKMKVDEALGEPIGGQPLEVQLPEERAGELLIFRTFDEVSYGLVMNTQRPVHVYDRVRNP